MHSAKILMCSILTAAVAGVAVPALGADTPATMPAAKVRVVACDVQVQSKKRGLCANDMSAEDFKAIAPGVSWYYTWNFEQTDNAKVPAGVNVEFVPMVWGNAPEQLEGLKKYLKTGAKPRAILAINEPNLKGQAFITPEETAALYKKIKAVGDEYKIEVVGPNMSLGSAKPDSITAVDPIDKKETTYTFMVPFLKAFQYYLGKEEMPAIGWHTYGEMGEFKWAIGQMGDEFAKPMWVTEYAYWKTGNPEGEIRYMIEATDLMERSPKVAAYAWFKERVNENRKLSILGKEPGTLTPLGKFYVNMPAHDSEVYYQIPGKLEAAKYATADEVAAAPSREKDTMLEIVASNGGGNLCYNINVPAAGEYTVDIRTTQGGDLLILDSNKKELADLTVANKGWQTVTATVKLPAGPQTLRLYPDSGGQAFTWLEFKKK